MLPESILGEKDILPGKIGYHRVRPVQHRGFYESECFLAGTERIAALDNLYLPPVQIEKSFEPPLSLFAYEDGRVRSKRHDLVKACDMVVLNVIDYDVPDS